MTYESIDTVQNYLAGRYFARTADAKKASGRALGTFVELITYYLLKAWGFQKNLAIETRLPEYGVSHLTHNVEFTLHKNISSLKNIEYNFDKSLSSATIIRHNQLAELPSFSATSPKILVSAASPKIIKNGLITGITPDRLLVAYMDTMENHYRVHSIEKQPFAMFECKRVGKEGTSKGPQTIEKAKQGAYVAKSISSLQKIVMPDGSLGGVYFDENLNCHIEPCNVVVDKLTKGILPDIPRFVLTVGIVSNHGNWFTSNNMNKELEILARSYDWLLFLQDSGLSRFVKDFLALPPCREAFEFSYSVDAVTGKKNPNIFTKSQISYDADRELTIYFKNGEATITSWFRSCLHKLYRMLIVSV